MLKNLKISQKIYMMTTIQFALILIIGWAGISQMAKIGNEIVDIAEDDVPLIKSLTVLSEHQLHQAILLERAIIKGLLVSGGVSQNIESVKAKAKQEFNLLNNDIRTLNKKVESDIIEVEKFIQQAITHLHSVEAKNKYKDVLGLLKKAKSHYLVLEKENITVLELINKGDIDQAMALSLTVEKHQGEVETELLGILKEVQQFTLDAALQAEHDEQVGIKYIIATLVIALVLSILIPMIIGRSITKPIRLLNERLKEVASGDGDLRLRLDDSASDETGQAASSFNKFMTKLSKTIKNVTTSAEELGGSSEQAIRVMSKTLDNVEKQRIETEMVASAIYQMSKATQDVASNTANAATVGEDAKKRVADGMNSAVENQSIIKNLASEVKQASSVIESLAAETDNIGTVLDAIRGIAEQTNLLALNAAIEAARAGDTGRGFAVVADEVRTLAQRTQSSTGDIQSLVESLQEEAKNAVASMQKGAHSTELCLLKSTETAQALEDASEAVNQISDLNTQIASTSEEQSATAEQITQNVTNISKIAEDASKGTAETAEANQNIGKRLIDLHSQLNQFQV